MKYRLISGVIFVVSLPCVCCVFLVIIHFRLFRFVIVFTLATNFFFQFSSLSSSFWWGLPNISRHCQLQLVSSWLDYCNSVLSGTSQSNLNRLQRVQNAVARTVMATSKREHITPVSAELHWLPVAARIDFKIATITFNLLTTEWPSYLRELLQLRRPSRSLTSGNHNLLNIPRPRTAFVQRSFSHAALPLVSGMHSLIQSPMISISLHLCLNPDLKHSCTKVPTTNHSVTL